MNPLVASCRCLAAAGVTLALICPAAAQAQQPARDILPFKVTASGVADVFVVPVEPPVVSARLNLKGASELLGGAITWLDLHTGHLGVDGTPNRITDAVSVFTGPTGDALFVQWAGAFRSSDKAGIYDLTGAFTINGGRGRFTGAAGSGTLHVVVNFSTLEVAYAWEGLVALPKR